MLLQRFERMVDFEKDRLHNVKMKIKEWRMKNERLDSMIERMSLINARDSADVKKEAIDKESKFTKDRIEAIMKRTRLVKDVHDSYNELIVLQTELELLRLKTYPTLKFKSEGRKETAIKKRGTSTTPHLTE